METDQIFENENEEAKPPLFKKWKSWYLLVIGELILLIVLFYWFTKAYS